MSYRKILLPTDGSEIGSAAALAGLRFAAEQGAEVIGLFVAPPYEYAASDSLPDDVPTEEEYAASMRRKGKSYLAPLQEAAASGLKFTGVVAFAKSAAQAILDAAEEHRCDLIFMGSHGRGGRNQALLGDVTLKILTACRMPVLVHRAQARQHE
ncbi:universal stress protein [Noviherbaspirillum sp.]|uniref:universal stress protein n=1 Tax=Noviherbaspirillum sp. TaxID=1926288 RepID=UPI002B46F51A|nr:universal stress protein [Noviherbaspirillum sp.]HJV79532.1 universal stress protein [Noviherbaspirillum sp.]